MSCLFSTGVARAEDRLRRVELLLGRHAVAPLSVHGALQVNSHNQILFFVLDGGRDTFIYYCGGRREQIRRALPRPIHNSPLPLFMRVVRAAVLKRIA